MVSKNIIFKQYYVEKLCGTIIYLFYVSICVALSCVYVSAFSEKFGLCFTIN